MFLILDDIKEDIHCCLIAETEKQNPQGTKLVVKVKDEIYYMGKLSAAKWVLNLLKDKATVNQSIADTYRFTQKYPFTYNYRLT